MNYIGSKLKLSKFIIETVQETVGDISEKVFCDLFAGTGTVGKTFKPLVKTVIANDLEYYSYVLNRNYIGNYTFFDYDHFLNELNNTDPIKGFIFENYSENGKANRKYFSEENGQKIDAIRDKIEEWKNDEYINENQYFFLLASLIESADKVANTAAVYGAFLKKIKPSAEKKMIIEPAKFLLNGEDHIAYNGDANEIILNIEGDILYLDPPYNERQYGSNYHILNTIALNDRFEPKGITGLRTYKRSSYCQRKNVLESFEDLIKNAKFDYIFLSYSNESLMTAEEVKTIMSNYGAYYKKEKEYQRFKADKTENRNHTATSTVEYIHILKKDIK